MSIHIYVSVWVCVGAWCVCVGLSVYVFVYFVDVFLCECHCLSDLDEGDQTSRLGTEMNATDVWFCVSECVFHVCDYICLCVSIPFTDLVKVPSSSCY